MNKVNFEQTGGFPLETNTLSFLQSAYGQLSGLAGLGGQSYILNGCTVAGGNVTDGTIVIDGEVLPFVGGPKLARIVIEESVEDKTFEDGVSKPVYYTRVAKMVASGGVMDFDSLKRVSNLLAMADRIKDQEVVQWTPVSDNLNNVIYPNVTECWMFKMGKLVILSGNIVFTFVGTGTQLGFVVNGFPAIGNIAGQQKGMARTYQVPDQETAFFTQCFTNPALNFSVNAPANTKWAVEFSITLYTV